MFFYIKGPDNSGQDKLAAALRNDAVLNRKGALILDANAKEASEVKPLVQKLLVGAELPDDVAGYKRVGQDAEGKDVVLTGIDALPWKDDCLVIIVGDAGTEVLEAVEAACPGFKAKFGTTSATVTTSVGA